MYMRSIIEESGANGSSKRKRPAPWFGRYRPQAPKEQEMSSTPSPSIAQTPATFAELRDAFTALDTSLRFRTPHKPTIKLGSRPYTYSIESDDKPGVFYTTDAYHMTCTCLAGRHHRRCWHLATAIQYDAWR